MQRKKTIMEKLEEIHKDITNIKINVAVTNGKVKIHEKLIWALGGGLMFLAGIIIYIKV